MNYSKKVLTCASALVISLGIFAGYSTTTFAASTSQNTSTKKTDSSAKSDIDSSSKKDLATKDDSEAGNVTDKKKEPAQTTTSYDIMTKVAGAKNYKVWKSVSNGKVHTKVADGQNFRYSHIQSNQSIKTKKYTYWLIYVDGRRVGWVNQNYFARNTIETPKTVSLVRNDNYTFDPKDAISYATDSTGTVVDNQEVNVSKSTINCGTPKTYKVKYTYGSGSSTVAITVRKSTKEGYGDADSVSAKKGTNDFQSWDSHYGASINYISPKEFQPETAKHTFSSGDLSLTTRLYQPVLLSIKTGSDDGNINRVGHIPEGVTVSNNWAYTSLLSHTNLMNGHIVGYDLSKLKSPYNPQHLNEMSQDKFNKYVQNIKVSPYIPIGHGQALGSTDKYIYALVNDHTIHQTTDSEELVQIRKSDMCINKIWTVKTWNKGNAEDSRYYQNAVVVDDHTMYGLYHDTEKHRYEYWKLSRTGDNWYSQLVGVTDGDFVNNGAPVQGFTYDSQNNNFYISFNDLIFKVAYDGTLKQSYQFKSGREVEGISISDNKLYVNLAQRAELLVGDLK